VHRRTGTGLRAQPKSQALYTEAEAMGLQTSDLVLGTITSHRSSPRTPPRWCGDEPAVRSTYRGAISSFHPEMQLFLLK
jgi:hypothetical protein